MLKNIPSMAPGQRGLGICKQLDLVSKYLSQIGDLKSSCFANSASDPPCAFWLLRQQKRDARSVAGVTAKLWGEMNLTYGDRAERLRCHVFDRKTMMYVMHANLRSGTHTGADKVNDSW